MEYSRLNYLKVHTRKQLITSLVKLIDEEYGNSPSYIEIASICRATIDLFKSLEGEDAELNKIVSSYCTIIV